MTLTKYAFYGAFTCVLLLAIVGALAELQSRIASKLLVESQIGLLKATLQGSDSNEVRSVPTDSLERQIAEYNIILNDIKFLEVAGADSSNNSIGHMRARMRDAAERLDQDRVISDLISDRDRLRSLVADANENSEPLLQFKAELELKLSQLQVEFQDEVTGFGSTGIAGFGPQARAIENELNRVANQIEQISAERDELEAQITSISTDIVAALSPEQRTVSWFYRMSPFASLPSEILTGLIMVLSGAAGSVITFYRGDRSGQVALTSGLLAGFVAYLLVKGGRFFFLISPNGLNSEVFLNPFALAFAAIVAGMFSGTAYSAIERAVEQAAKKVAPATESKDSEPK